MNTNACTHILLSDSHLIKMSDEEHDQAYRLHVEERPYQGKYTNDLHVS